MSDPNMNPNAQNPQDAYGAAYGPAPQNCQCPPPQDMGSPGGHTPDKGWICIRKASALLIAACIFASMFFGFIGGLFAAKASQFHNQSFIRAEFASPGFSRSQAEDPRVFQWKQGCFGYDKEQEGNFKRNR